MKAARDAGGYDILLEDVTKEFDGQTVVSHASLRVKKGEIFGFIGPSGSGKTTTIRLLTGVYVPTTGHVRVLGSEPARFSRRDRESIGYLPQQFVLYPNLSVLENMRFISSLYGLSPFRRNAPIRRWLEFVQMWDHRDKLASDISGGMQRRLGLAAALVHDPQLLFADEPTAGIDPILREHVWEEFKQLKEDGRTLFVTTQYVTEAEYCDHVALMADGKIVANDTPEGLRRQALGGEAVDITAQGLTRQLVSSLGRVGGVRNVERKGAEDVRVYVEDAGSMLATLIGTVQELGATVEQVEEYRPNFDEVFVLLLEKHRELGPEAADRPENPVRTVTELGREHEAEARER